MREFEYHKPESLDDAISKLHSLDDAVAIAGGMTLLPTMKQRLAEPAALVDLTGISEMKSVTASENSVTVGALVRHAEVARSPEIKAAIPALAELAGGIGDPQVRNRGTLGGSVANADPAADYPAAMVGLDATVITNQREISADAFFTGLFETALETGELITAVGFSKPQAAAYAKFPNPASRYAIVGVFVAKFATGVRVAITGAGASVFRGTDLEAALSDRFEPSAIDGITVSSDGLNTDIHAEAAYRAHLIGVMTKRAVSRALGEAN